jgi:hypothetical protein
VWNWTTSGSIGATMFDSSGSDTITGDPDDQVVVDFKNHQIRLISDVTYAETAAGVLSSGNIKVSDLHGKVLSEGKHFDQLIKLDGTFQWDTGDITGTIGEYDVKSSGFVPFPDGGAGAFSTRIQTVPEPSTWALAILGFLSLILPVRIVKRKRLHVVRPRRAAVGRL